MIVWLSLDDLARYLKKPKSTLYKLAQAAKLPGHKLGRSWRFDRDEIDAWVKRGGTSGNRKARRQ
ncbi:helix-turn-helix domain-containing protein [Fontivita pretiosa]|uniref:helix-turn-helix domain-containing protein n=1 Tax=Fontivita pretiosa TaxID=2989684 RepID=UPI003D16D082